MKEVLLPSMGRLLKLAPKRRHNMPYKHPNHVFKEFLSDPLLLTATTRRSIEHIFLTG